MLVLAKSGALPKNADRIKLVNYDRYYNSEQQLTKRGDHQGSVPGAGGSARQPQRAAVAPVQPAWAKGLQRLYDDVVDEALPDDLASLLDQLDQLDRAADDK